MGILNRLFRHSPLSYIAFAVLGAGICALSLLRTGTGYTLAWADALSTAGLILVLLGFLMMISHFGAFDSFGYSFSTLGARRYKDLYAYTQAKKEKRTAKGWGFMPPILVGAVFLLFGLVLWNL